MNITKDEVKHLAKLSSISLNESEVENLRGDLCNDSLPFYNFPFLVSIQTKMGASYALFVEFSSRRDAFFDGRKYLLHIDIFDVIQYFCQNCKFSTKNQRAIRI
jgi:hypothetical protein